PLEIGLIILAILLLFGYKKLPDASRSLGRSLRIFKGEMKGMKDDDVRTRAEAETVRPVLETERFDPYPRSADAPRANTAADAPKATAPPARSDDR
ncbi:MAG: Sec-independent protein translocase subunit TatA, partial [Actinomycetota bacterium]|nr:Sec-independent protein translocase subunit TatA [Actinomycetota bacterium]